MTTYIDRDEIIDLTGAIAWQQVHEAFYALSEDEILVELNRLFNQDASEEQDANKNLARAIWYRLH